MASGIGGISHMTTGYFQIKQTRPVTAGHGYWWVWVLGGYPKPDPDPYPWGTQPVNPPGTSYPPSFTRFGRFEDQPKPEIIYYL